MKEGGAIYTEDIEEIVLNKNTFLRNSVSLNNIFSKGGSIYSKNTQKFSIYNTKIENSTAYMYGGGIYLLNLKEFDLKNSQFIHNSVHFLQNTSIN